MTGVYHGFYGGVESRVFFLGKGSLKDSILKILLKIFSMTVQLALVIFWLCMYCAIVDVLRDSWYLHTDT